jgi:long-chain acyl-CoA synthetase
VSSLAANLARASAEHPHAAAIKLDDLQITYAQLDELSARAAQLLAGRGVGAGDRVGLMLPNVPQFSVAYHAILRLGAIVVPMNVLLKRREVDFYLGNSGAEEMFVWHGFAGEAPDSAIVVTPGGFEQQLAALEPLTGLVDRDDSDTAVILFTSGTTGTPKGAELTHGSLRQNCEVAVELFDLGIQDVVFGGLPLFHSFGQTCGLNASVAGAACLTLLPRFDPEKALEIVDRDQVTVFEGVPTMYVAMLNSSAVAHANASSLRVCVSGGSALPLEVLRGFEKRFECQLLEGYGLSETSPISSFNHPDREQKPGSIGTPIRGVEMKVVDERGGDLAVGEVGEIVIRGHNVMKGYWNHEEATAEAIRDGWFHTGDLAKVDEDGYFFIVDRKKDMIIRGGYNVYPREIEEVLYEHPSVREAAVVGIPHDDLGEEVCAAVAFKEGSAVDATELRDFVKERVAAYKYPRHVWFVDELPKGPTGKVLKREIHAPAEILG